MRRHDILALIAAISLLAGGYARCDENAENMETLRDPFRPVETVTEADGDNAAASTDRPVLRGILYSKEDPQALLSVANEEKILSRKDEIGGFILEEIEEDRVIVSDSKSKFILRLYENITDNSGSPEAETPEED